MGGLAFDRELENSIKCKIENEIIPDSKSDNSIKAIIETPKKEKLINPDIFTPIKDALAIEIKEEVTTPLKEDEEQKMLTFEKEPCKNEGSVNDKSKKRSITNTILPESKRIKK